MHPEYAKTIGRTAYVGIGGATGQKSSIRKSEAIFLEGVESDRQMVVCDMVPRDFKVVKQSAIQGNTEEWQSNSSRSSNVAPMGALMANRQPINWRGTFTLMIRIGRMIKEHRGDHNRLGFAVQLCTVRFLGTFLENLSDTPNSVVAFIGQQLGVRNLAALKITASP